MMNQTEIKKFYRDMQTAVDEGHLLDSFAALTSVAEDAMQWEISDRLKTLRQHYGYLLSYFTKGISDPGRDIMLGELKEKMLFSLDALTRNLMSRECPTLYFNTLRTIESNPEVFSLTYLLDRYKNRGENSADKNIFESAMRGGSLSDRSGDANIERLEKDIFLKVWTLFPIGNAEYTQLESLLTDDLVDSNIKELAVSAIWLGGMEYFDPARIKLLTDLYLYTNDPRLKARTIISLVLLLCRHRHRSLGRDLESKISMLSDNPEWNRSVIEAFTELIRASGTKQLTESVQRDIIDRLTPGAIEMFNNLSSKDMTSDPADPLFNPEWEKLLGNSEIRDKMQELGEIQEEGGDVFMAAFARLKQFPFFNDISNWFLPFRTSHTVFNAPGGSLEQISKLVAQIPYLCDSDKYSTMLSMSMVPPEKSDMLTSQMSAAINFLESQPEGAELHEEDKRFRMLLNGYSKSLYRFYELFRRKGEFVNPFEGGIGITEVGVLSPVFSDPTTMSGIAEFYFKIKCWDEALSVFKLIDRQLAPESSRYQKMGLCEERMNRLDKAVDYYERAELLDSESIWVIRRLGECLWKSGNKRRAAKYLQRLNELEPDNRETMYRLASSLLDNDDTTQAQAIIEKALYLFPDDKRFIALNARLSLYANKLTEAYEQYRSILDFGKATDGQLLDFALCQWAKGDIMGAVDTFCSLERRRGSGSIVSVLSENKPLIKKLGIKLSDIPLMADAVADSYRQN